MPEDNQALAPLARIISEVIAMTSRNTASSPSGLFFRKCIVFLNCCSYLGRRAALMLNKNVTMYIAIVTGQPIKAADTNGNNASTPRHAST